MVRVVGLADTTHLVTENPLDPANRRITITLLRESPVLPPGIATTPALP